MNINIVGGDKWYGPHPPEGNSTRGSGPKLAKITLNQKTNNQITYFINDGMYQHDKYLSRVKVALISDCRCIVPWHYDWLDKNHYFFNNVATYDDVLIDNLKSKAWVTPAGGTFIWGPEQWKIYKKNKLCSYVTSRKKITQLQKQRVELLDYFYDQKNKNIDLFGNGHNPIPDVIGKIESLKDYYFTIAIENHESEHYFSEKLIDCFLTGTIPIYIGSKKIFNYFDPLGIIVAKDIQEIKQIVNSISVEEYERRYKAVKNNFFLAKENFIDSIEYSYKNYFLKK